MKTSIKHGAVVRCDADVDGQRCEERFQSNSFAMVIRKQTEAAGWGYVPSLEARAKRKADHAARKALLQQQKQEKRAQRAAKKGAA